jgi:hypothetical protein
VRKFLASKQITLLEHPPYSQDLAPNDFFLFPKIKEILKGKHFDDIDNIRRNTTAALKASPQNQFQNCFEAPQSRFGRYGEVKILAPPGLELQPLGRPALSQSLYRLHYPASGQNV